ncbi:MAG TPA: AraC family transcriptional regulator [Bryobacteraceae bacterium]|jgi:AraC-like DNA-binding protein
MATTPYQRPHLFPQGALIGLDNVVLNARAKRHRVEGIEGPLSIKTVIDGRVAWIVGGRSLVVDCSSFLVLSAGERYGMDIEELKPVETCCVFFAPGFVERVALDATSPLNRALDSPERVAPSLPYLSALHADKRDGSFVRHIHTLAPRCRQLLAPSGFEEDFLLLADALLAFYQQVREEMARVPAAKASTKKELYRRLLVGREYIHAHPSEEVSLGKVARSACLSPFHFHRGFTKAFGQTPHSYVTGLRLAEARRQLQSGVSALDACLNVGFSSPSAFSRLFRAQFGEPPSAIRRK